MLVRARPAGPACHRGTTSCFGDATSPGLGFLAELSEIVERRFHERPVGSYTTSLIEAGRDRMAQKVGEEAVEVVIASKNAEAGPLVSEAADLVFHLMVLLRDRGLALADVVEVLRERHRR